MKRGEVLKLDVLLGNGTISLKKHELSYGEGERKMILVFIRARFCLFSFSGDSEENTGDSAVEIDRSSSQLRPAVKRILLRSSSGSLCSDPELLPHRQAPLSDPRLRSTLWGRARILGIGFQSSRALLLDDIHRAQRHSSMKTAYLPPFPSSPSYEPFNRKGK